MIKSSSNFTEKSLSTASYAEYLYNLALLGTLGTHGDWAENGQEFRIEFYEIMNTVKTYNYIEICVLIALRMLPRSRFFEIMQKFYSHTHTHTFFRCYELE